MSKINGVAKKYDGSAIDYVSIFNWDDGKCIAQVKPNPQGIWSFNYASNISIGIAYVANGCAPITHGPYQLLSDWSPQVLFTGQQGCWYDLSDLSTLFQDVEGAMPVNLDGQRVALMRDKSGRGNHMVQPVITAMPVYRSCGNVSWLEFDGIDDYMEVPTTRFTSPVLMSVASELLSFTSDIAAVQGAGYLNNADGFGYFLGRNPNSAYTQLRNTSTVSQIEVPRPNGAHVATIDASLQSNSLKINDQPAATIGHTLGAITSNQNLMIGSRRATSGLEFFSNIKFYGSLILEGGVSAEDKPKLVDYLAAKSGINL